MNVLYLAILQIIMSILLSVVVFFISYKILLKLFGVKDQKLNNDNLALSIFFSGIIFSTGYLLSGIIPSIISAIELLKINNGDDMYVKIIKYSSLALFFGFLMASMIQFSAFVLIKTMTKYVKEVDELKRNNLAVAILLSTILISITLISKDSLVFLIELYMPQPDVVKFI
ncbi:DUF350 domain-containing protein [Ichthyenterobacterium sp. W332]|uniref:DUF350 domain-containing protein n=1 Tax=Microcosmobacter mediterraneus TaxID=3075607 RepID=A0ABU2YMR2_9FLAO|nr:DUF350 domain-containing protein [Ichthyenterobacterium sp. W332]MDT0558358.1 DUF350 domain-containing protein [Ichthyenterobacterium sp. W332]